MFVYLAHPIDQVAGQGYRSVLAIGVGDIIRLATEQGCTLFQPAGAYRLPGRPWVDIDVHRVDLVNRAAIFESDAVIAVLPPGIPTLGVPAEIEYAIELGRPVLIVTTSVIAASSVQLASWRGRGAAMLEMKDTGEIPPCILADQLPVARPEIRMPNLTGPPALLYSGEAANLQIGKYAGDAGIDLATSQEVRVEPGTGVRVHTGVRIAIPQGYFAWMTARSSTFSKLGLEVRDAVIDAGYRGEMMIQVYNPTVDPVDLQAGVRLAQLVLLPAFTGRVDWTAELPPSQRGESGWGSSGE